MYREMTIDREHGRYKESITGAQTGEVVHQCDEPSAGM
jgi:hypothetical protein